VSMHEVYTFGWQGDSSRGPRRQVSKRCTHKSPNCQVSYRSVRAGGHHCWHFLLLLVVHRRRADLVAFRIGPAGVTVRLLPSAEPTTGPLMVVLSFFLTLKPSVCVPANLVYCSATPVLDTSPHNLDEPDSRQ